MVAQLLPEFEASHPGLRVHVQQIPFLSAHEKFLTAAVAQRTPDLAQLGNTWIPEFATIGALEPLDEELAATPSLAPDDFFSGSWSANEFAGHTYGVPWYVDTRLLFFRTDLLHEAGFAEPPRTWDEWLAMLRAIQQQGRPGPGGDPRAALFLRLDEPELLLALGLQQAPLLRDGDRYGNFRSAGFVQALEYYSSLAQVGLLEAQGASQVANLWDDFARGAFVFYIGGPWQLGELGLRLPEQLRDSWNTAQLPGRDGPGASLALGASLVMFKGSPRRREAWQLIQYLSRPDVQRRFYELTGDLPPRRSSWEGSDLAAQRGAAAYRAQLEQMYSLPAVPEWERIKGAVITLEERAARGVITPRAAAVELDRRTDRILEKRRWILERAATRTERNPAGSSRAVGALP
ncbi:MAG TPA: extracellular solute-binding protein [Polyangiaceae bacterium]|nr:extracellular solute-binding protein [Polyangiaceae bacterium]